MRRFETVQRTRRRAAPDAEPPSGKEARHVNVEEIADRLSIADVLYRYATALDTRDWALLEAVFARDGVYVMGARGEFAGVDAIAEKLSSVLGGYDSTQHLIGNPTIAVDGGRAHSTSSVRADHHWVDDAGAHTMELGGVYRDVLARTPQGWRIEHRVLEVIWREGAPRATRSDESDARVRADR
jgi:hypothetical protein